MPPPSDVDLVVDAIADIASRPSELIDLVRLAAADVRSSIAKVAHVGVEVAETIRRTIRPAPPSVLNVTMSGQRRFATFRADLADIKSIRSAHGASVNDVILTVITGALADLVALARRGRHGDHDAQGPGADVGPAGAVQR